VGCEAVGEETCVFGTVGLETCGIAAVVACEEVDEEAFCSTLTGDTACEAGAPAFTALSLFVFLAASASCFGNAGACPPFGLAATVQADLVGGEFCSFLATFLLCPFPLAAGFAFATTLSFVCLSASSSEELLELELEEELELLEFALS